MCGLTSLLIIQVHTMIAHKMTDLPPNVIATFKIMGIVFTLITLCLIMIAALEDGKCSCGADFHPNESVTTDVTF